jgi:hypothetical protein
MKRKTAFGWSALILFLAMLLAGLLVARARQTPQPAPEQQDFREGSWARPIYIRGGCGFVVRGVRKRRTEGGR